MLYDEYANVAADPTDDVRASRIDMYNAMPGLWTRVSRRRARDVLKVRPGLRAGDVSVVLAVEVWGA